MFVRTFRNQLWTKLLKEVLIPTKPFLSLGISKLNSYSTITDAVFSKQHDQTFSTEKIEALKKISSQKPKGDCGNKPNNEVETKYRYHEEVEKAINGQIVAELQAAYSYLCFSSFFGRTSVGLLGVQKFYMNMYTEETEHAMMLIEYQEMRGGRVNITTINVCEFDEDCTILKSLEMSLCMEKVISDQLTQVYSLAKKYKDFRTQDFIVTEFIKEQTQSIRHLGVLIATANRMGDTGLAEFFLDKELNSTGGHATVS